MSESIARLCAGRSARGRTRTLAVASSSSQCGGSSGSTIQGRLSWPCARMTRTNREVRRTPTPLGSLGSQRTCAQPPRASASPWPQLPTSEWTTERHGQASELGVGDHGRASWSLPLPPLLCLRPEKDGRDHISTSTPGLVCLRFARIHGPYITRYSLRGMSESIARLCAGRSARGRTRTLAVASSSSQCGGSSSSWGAVAEDAVVLLEITERALGVDCRTG